MSHHHDKANRSSRPSDSRKVALVCDWLTNVGGAEKVLLSLHQLFPDAPIYTSQYDPQGIDWFKNATVKTGWLQKFPVGLRRFLGPLRQRYFSHLDLSEYDLVISVTGAEAKAVRAGNKARPGTLHLCYCHVPTQYYWQMYDAYLENPGFGVLNPLVRLFLKLLVRPLRRADLRAATRPDYFITISEYARGLIAKYYGREAVVIHPPVEIAEFSHKMLEYQISKNNKTIKSQGPVSANKYNVPVKSQDKSNAPAVENFDVSRAYITTSRQVNWKRLDLAIKAAIMTQRPLLIIGEGPEHQKLVKLAGGSRLIRFLPLMDKKALSGYLAQARGYLFPSLEPFGIAPVEALAAGCPVIAYGAGGARDYITDGKNGLLFPRQTAKSLAEAILKFEKMRFNRERVAHSVKSFNTERFNTEILRFVKKCEKKGAKHAQS